MTYEQRKETIEFMFRKMPELLTIDEVAKALRCGDKAIRRMLAEGTLPHVVVAQRYLIIKAYLIDYLIKSSAGGVDDEG